MAGSDTTDGKDGAVSSGILAPLRDSPVFRSIWLTGLLSNLGQLIQNVGAAWEMTRLTGSTEMVALIQSATMLPMMLIALPAGAIADTFDRRKVALGGLGFAGTCAAILTIAAWLGWTSPALLLASCVMIGAGNAFFAPAWQASVSEQVDARHLPAAIALNSISYNVARSIGPAIGGVLLAAFGAAAAFGSNAISYVPLIVALVAWRRPASPSRLPAESIGRAIVSGVRYAWHSPPLRVVLARTLLVSGALASINALLPFVARDLLGGTALTYGLLLGAIGLGAIAGAMLVPRLRARYDAETGVRRSLAVATVMVATVALSHSLALSLLALAAYGAAWINVTAQLNVSVQVYAPRWVTARAVSCYTCAITGGLGIGAWAWGAAAIRLGAADALLWSAAACALTALVGWRWAIPDVEDQTLPRAVSELPKAALPLTHRSGPIVIEIDYRVAPDNARDFYNAMREVRRVRLRSGGFDWSLSRDIADAERWTERYHCPTWGDYIRQRERMTASDQQAVDAVQALHIAVAGENRLRRMLERPMGSVRPRADTPDPHQDSVNLYTP